jgi:hypothetical protein
MHMIVHAGAYFLYDSIIEIYYKTADTLTNMHHVFVLVATYFHLNNSYSGWEYIRKIFFGFKFYSSITFYGWAFKPFFNHKNCIKN